MQLTMQAQSNEDRAQWLNVMEGEEPVSMFIQFLSN